MRGTSAPQGSSGTENMHEFINKLYALNKRHNQVAGGLCPGEAPRGRRQATL